MLVEGAASTLENSRKKEMVPAALALAVAEKAPPVKERQTAAERRMDDFRWSAKAIGPAPPRALEGGLEGRGRGKGVTPQVTCCPPTRTRSTAAVRLRVVTTRGRLAPAVGMSGSEGESEKGMRVTGNMTLIGEG